MKLTKIDGHASLVKGLDINAAQFALVQAIRELNGGDVISRKNLKAAHLQLRNKSASPYFIAKNVDAKAKNAPGSYNLSKFKLLKGEVVNAIEAAATPEPTAETPVIVKGGKKEKGAKKEKMTLTAKNKMPKRPKKVAVENAVAAESIADAAQAAAEPLPDVPETI